MGFVPVPLHKVHVKSGLVTGFLSVAVRPCFPVDGVDFIMGNHIAGGRGYPVLEIVNTPVPVSVCEEFFPVCAVTRAQGQKKKDLELGDCLR